MQGNLSTNPLVFDELKTEFYYVVKFRRYDILLWKELRSGARDMILILFVYRIILKLLKLFTELIDFSFSIILFE